MKTQKMNVRNYWNQWSAWIRKICFGEMDKVVKQKTPLPSGRNENPDEVLFSLETFLTGNLAGYIFVTVQWRNDCIRTYH